MPFPYRRANGAICCSRNEPHTLCDDCKAKLDAEQRANVTPQHIRRSAAASRIPDPWAKPLDELRGHDAIDLTPDLDPNTARDPNHPPDSWAIGLAVEQAKKDIREGK